MSGAVVAIQRTPGRRATPEVLERAVLVTDLGVEGDHHVRPGSGRQVVLSEVEVLDRLGLAPGAIREQVCVRGIEGCRAGDVVDIGEVRLELTGRRVPCGRMDEVRPGLRAELSGQGGWCARVLRGGEIAVGDVVRVDRGADPEWLSEYRAAAERWQERPDPRVPLVDALPHLIVESERAVAALASAPDEGRVQAGADGGSAGATDASSGATDASTGPAAKPLGHENSASELWRRHDLALTAIVDAARRGPDGAERWVRALTEQYRDRTCG